MKKFSLVIVLVFTSFSAIIAQEDAESLQGKDEIKLNVFNLIAFKFVDASYERLIDEESSFGLGVLLNAGGDDDIFDYYRKLSVTPYYRRYFSKGYAKGFFVEGFGMLNSGEEDYYIYNENTQESQETNETYTDVALGISIGGKFVSRRGFVAEIYGGIGRNFFNTEFSPEVVGRGGVSLGFRF
tara:strand:- start:25911 stop:26462 length:552 start_codon:yes stop_codon:yes gene_type:complete